ncbi:MAG: RsmB/NOP family class I SAM-dependent RNA methyltransferase [Bacteroidetes bacterium]|nr:RsmB/NOP family class I SAM-dependent RNA methyltransferase [Bacteroidota bacterium]
MKPTLPDSFPEAFVERYTSTFGQDRLNQILTGFDADRWTWFRVNLLKSDIESTIESLRDLGIAFQMDPNFPDAGYVLPEQRDALLGSKLVEKGLVYVQGLASQLPVRFLDLRPGLSVLDLAAAPGSKTLQIAQLTSVQDEIAAVELVRKRKFKLLDNLRRHGAEYVRVFLQDGSKVWKYRPEYFDRVLLDAPCSSEGRFQLNDPSSFSYWSSSKVKEMVRKQRRLLFSAVHSLKPGGVLVYSTCAISPEENEGAIEHVLSAFDGSLEVVPIEFEAAERVKPIMEWKKKPLDDQISGVCRLIPSERMEGFFVCKLIKTASSNPESLVKRDSRR